MVVLSHFGSCSFRSCSARKSFFLLRACHGRAPLTSAHRLLTSSDTFRVSPPVNVFEELSPITRFCPSAFRPAKQSIQLPVKHSSEGYPTVNHEAGPEFTPPSSSSWLFSSKCKLSRPLSLSTGSESLSTGSPPSWSRPVSGNSAILRNLCETVAPFSSCSQCNPTGARSRNSVNFTVLTVCVRVCRSVSPTWCVSSCPTHYSPD